MRILITGICGFVGSHVFEHFILNTDFEIIGLDKLSYASDGFNRLRDTGYYEDKRLHLFSADFAYPISPGLTKEIGEIDYILHLGGETHVDRSLQDGLPFAINNVVGTTNLLEWVKNYQPKLKKYIQFSTDEVYGPALEGFFFNEWDTMHPSNPYAASKAGADMMAYAYGHAFNIPMIIARSMNIAGQRQCSEKFIPKTIKAILNNEKVIIHGSSIENLSSRCWIHARNVADALLFLLNTNFTFFNDMYHIVGVEKTVLDIANIICQEIRGRDLEEYEIEFVDFHKARKGHDKRYAMSGEKLKRLGWLPKIPLEESIRTTVRWTLENKKWLEI